MQLTFVVALLDLENFPHSKTAADNSTSKFRQKKILEGPISAEWDMDDHLVALKARMSPLKAVGVELLSAAIRVYGNFWPECEPPKTVAELAKCLMGSEERLDDWRSSAARREKIQACLATELECQVARTVLVHHVKKRTGRLCAL